MTDTITSYSRISGTEITGHKTYKAPEGYSIIYLHECHTPDTEEVFYYVGSTDGSIKERCGKLFANYHYGANTNSKFTTYLRTYGCHRIRSRILWVVPDEIRAIVEQEEIERYNALGLGFNSIRAVKETTCPAKVFNNGSKASEKNQPTEISVENYQIICEHRDKSISRITINKGLYEHYFSNLVICLDTPGMKGTPEAHPRINGRKVSKTILRYIGEDLNHNLKYGPDGRHTVTLDNIYLTGTKTSLRTFLDQNPAYIKKVSYLTFGSWEE